MKPLQLNEVNHYVNEHIEDFHNRRIKIISSLALNQLTAKNPYLFRAKNIKKAIAQKSLLACSRNIGQL